MAIYLDLVILLNFLVDFLLLLGTNRLSGFPQGVPRCALAALVGAVYSGACLLPSFSFLAGPLWRFVSLGIMAVLAFGLDHGAWKRGSVFLLLSFALGGAALSLGRGAFGSLILAAVVVWLLCSLSFGGSLGSREYVPVTLAWGSSCASFLALRDSGNTLRDPITGEQVLVIAGSIAQRLTGLTELQLRSPLETLAHSPVPGLRLIPYQAVGSRGFLLGMRFADVKIGSRRQSAVVAFAPEGLGDGTMYQGLTGGAI